MVKRSLVTFHYRQRLLKLTWFGILRVKRSPVHTIKPVPGSILQKPHLDLLSSPHFHYRLKHKVHSTLWVYSRV